LLRRKRWNDWLAGRQLEREKNGMAREETKLKNEIKKLAKDPKNMVFFAPTNPPATACLQIANATQLF